MSLEFQAVYPFIINEFAGLVMAKIDTHSCKEMTLAWGKDDSVSIEFPEDWNAWVFAYRNYVDDVEVRMGEAEHEGELVSSFQTRISYCPYCGSKL